MFLSCSVVSFILVLQVMDGQTGCQVPGIPTGLIHSGDFLSSCGTANRPCETQAPNKARRIGDRRNGVPFSHTKVLSPCNGCTYRGPLGTGMKVEYTPGAAALATC